VDESINYLYYSDTIIISTPLLGGVRVGVDDLIPIECRNAIVADHCSHQTQNYAAIRVRVESLGQDLGGGVDELLFGVYAL
jgi:hypothetical protein